MTIVSTTGYNCLDAAIRAGNKEVCMEIIKHEKYVLSLRYVLCNYMILETLSVLFFFVHRFHTKQKILLQVAGSLKQHKM